MDKRLDELPDDPVLLKAMIAEERAARLQMAASVRAYEALVQALKVRIARLRRQKFGASSEKIERQIEQLELALEALEVKRAAEDPRPDPENDGPGNEGADQADPAATMSTPRRRGKPRISEDAPRERVVLDPGETCPECGGKLRMLGEDVSEILEFVAAKLKVVEAVRLKKSCRRCEKIEQRPSPTRPVPRGMAGPGLLAHILVAKFDDHLPLYRQGEIFARLGAEIPRSTLIDWCGQAAAALRPLADRIKRSVFSADRLHADDTPIRVLDPARKARGKDRGVKEGRIWTYVRDDRPWCGGDPPAVAYFFSPDRRGEHPRAHLADFVGILQADAYSGFKALYGPGALYDIERQITGRPAEARWAVRQRESRPRVNTLHDWLGAQITRLPGKGDLARAMRYALSRWPAFTLFLDDGRVAIDNNAAERAVKPVVIGRKNWMFAGSDAGGETLADAMTIIETAKLSSLNPEAYLADVLARINDHPNPHLDELLPWHWSPIAERSLAA